MLLARGRHGKSCRLTRIHLEEDTGKSTHAGSGDGRIAGSSLLAARFQPRGRAADGVRLRAGAAQRSRSGRVSRIAAAHAARARRQRRQDGGRLAALRCQRLGAPVRRDRARHQDRDQEHELVPLGRPRDRERDRAPDRRDRSGGRIVQETRGWDEAHGVTPFDAQQRRGARLPLLSRPRPRADGDPAGARRRAARRAAGASVASASSATPRVRPRRRRRRRSWSTTFRSRSTSTTSWRAATTRSRRATSCSAIFRVLPTRAASPSPIRR